MKIIFALATGFALFSSATAATAGSPSDPSDRIDEILNRSLAGHGIEANAPADDATFLRRIYLDVAGRIPTKAEADAFHASSPESKRAELIDELLDSEGYVNHFYNFWADILRLHSNANGAGNSYQAYSEFVKESLRENKPYDEFVRDLITSDGASADDGAVGYYMRDRGMPLDNLANTVRIFLGTRLECAQCHNHPFDKWSQMDFYTMAAFSYGMTANNNYSSGKISEATRLMNKSDKWGKEEKRDLNRAFQEIRRPLRNGSNVSFDAGKLPQLPHDYQYSDAEPKQKIGPATMFGTDAGIEDPEKRLEAYAAWMTSPDNPRFATVIANRLWREAMGVGLIEPVDEFTDQTVASDPELLQYLEEQIIATGFDMKAFLRIVFKSQAYQRETTKESLALGEPYYFQGPLMRRMSAEQVWDSVVTLINPTPDLPDWKRRQQGQLTLASQAAFSEAINSYSSQQLLQKAEHIARMQASQREDYSRLQKEILKARERKDNDKVKALSRESNEIRNKLRQEVTRTIYDPAFRRMDKRMVPVSYPGESDSVMQMNLKEVVNKDGRTNSEFQKQQREMENKLIEEQMDALGITGEKARKAYAGYRRGISARYMRAANLQSPAPRGHFLREFGQSDRETIENAENAASVPQALTLLNGDTFSALTGVHSVLRRAVDPIESPAGRLDAIFESLLTRRATPEEQSLLLGELEKRGNDLYVDAIYAVFNSPEFLFIQ